MQGFEVRLEEVESELKGVKKDVNKINVDITLLAQRQQSNAKAIDNLNHTILNNHSSQMQVLSDISKTQSEASNKLGFIRGALLSFGVTTLGGGTAAVTAGNESVINFLKMAKDLIL